MQYLHKISEVNTGITEAARPSSLAHRLKELFTQRIRFQLDLGNHYHAMLNVRVVCLQIKVYMRDSLLMSNTSNMMILRSLTPLLKDAEASQIHCCFFYFH